MSEEKDKIDIIHQPHDFLFKKTFGKKEVILDFLANRLPKKVFARIDHKSLQLTNKSFVNPVGKRGESDLIFRTKIDKQAGYIYALVEHQSAADPHMPLRFLEYNVQLIRQHLSEEGHTTLPLIMNICLYNGHEAYKGATNLLAMFDSPELVKDYIFASFQLVDLYSEHQEDILKDKQAALAELVLKQGTYRDFPQWIAQYKKLLSPLLKNKEGAISRR